MEPQRSWADLDGFSLISIMNQVPQDQRLACCALVCKSWAAAAVAATTSAKTRQLEDCAAWSEQHAAHITSLIIPGPQTSADRGMIITQLPAPLLAHLVQLRIMSCSLQLAPSSGAHGVLSCATKLQSLEIYECNILDGAPALTAALSALPNLQELQLQYLRRGKTDALKLPRDLLSVVTQLTRLDLVKTEQDHAVLTHLDKLTKLQHLCLRSLYVASELQGLEQLAQLAALTLRGVRCVLSPTSTPGLLQLTGLTELQLLDCRYGVQPDVLLPLTALQHLVLRGVNFLQDKPDAAATQLLAWLGQLQHLTRLQLQSPNDQDGQPLQLEPASACTALTASSKLCNLDLAVHAPRNVLQHCFVQGQQLPCLTSLIADGFCSFNRDDLQSVAVCCPSLRSLNLQPPLSWTPAAAEAKGNCDLSPLLQLHHLTQLTLWNVDDAAAGQLARLTELRCLQVLRPSDVTDVGLLRLTALTALEYLSVYQSSPGAALMGPGGFRLNCVLSQAPFGSPPDVWQQLLECCKRSPACRAVLEEQQQLCVGVAGLDV